MCLLDHIPRELTSLVVLGGTGHDLLPGELTSQVLHLALLIAQLHVETGSGSGVASQGGYVVTQTQDGNAVDELEREKGFRVIWEYNRK